MPGEPILKPIGESIWAVYPERATFEFSRIAEHRDSLSAEISVVSTTSGELHWARVNLTSTQTRASLSRALEDLEPAGDWGPLVERACRRVAQHLRQGEPAVPLIARAPTTARWLVEGLIPQQQLSVLYGDGGAGKSYLALGVVLAGLLQHPLSARWRVAPIARALYLDWESGEAEQAARLHHLTEGLGRAPVDGTILHRTMRRPLLDDLTAIRAEIDREHVDLVIADSLAPACGPDPETATVVVPVLGGLRSLAVTVIILAHVSKASTDTKAPARPWGSVFIQNLPRSTIECRRSDPTGDEQSYVLSLYHRKINEGRVQPPSALEMTFATSGAVTIRHARADGEGAGLSYQILELLRNGPAKPGQLAENLDAKPATITRTLRRLENAGKVIPITRTTGGRGKESEWGLVDTTRTENPDTSRESVRVHGDDDRVPF